MERQAILYLAVGFLLGAVLIWILQPGGASETPQLLGGKYVVMSNQHGNWIYERQANGEFKPVVEKLNSRELIDGKYVSFSNDYGNWVYERQADGSFKPVVKDMTPRGLRTIWELQAEFQPRSIETEGGQILHIPGHAGSCRRQFFEPAAWRCVSRKRQR